MKTEKKPVLVLLFSLIAGLVFSCTSTGEYMPLSNDETVIGTVQAVFEVRSTLFFMKTNKNIDTVNKQAYIKLLEAAEKKYSGNIDIRDIVWVTGKTREYTEVSASGKVVQVK
jgi:hypothetical protein